MEDQPKTLPIKEPKTPLTKNPKTIILLVFGLIVGIILLTYIATRPTSEYEDNIVEVEITAEGFVPSTIIIDAGDTVRWINTDSNSHYISSNPHPEESDLPDLTSGGGLGLNGEYEYTFTNPGTFNYHDHLNPVINGVVKVK